MDILAVLILVAIIVGVVAYVVSTIHKDVFPPTKEHTPEEKDTSGLKLNLESEESPTPSSNSSVDSSTTIIPQSPSNFGESNHQVSGVLGLSRGESAGAGVWGLLGFYLWLGIAYYFFDSENYFISMLAISLALLIYVTGRDITTIFKSCIKLALSNEHLITRASYLVETLGSFNKILRISKGSKNTKSKKPLVRGSTISLPGNEFTRDVQKLVQGDRSYNYAEFIAHSYYRECHQLYDYSINSLEFVADAMPLFGLIGTIIGLIAMFDGLGANVAIETLTPQLALALKTTLYGAIFSSVYKIISSRFLQRSKALEYDYESICDALEVVIENKYRVVIKT